MLRAFAFSGLVGYVASFHDASVAQVAAGSRCSHRGMQHVVDCFAAVAVAAVVVDVAAAAVRQLAVLSAMQVGREAWQNEGERLAGALWGAATNEVRPPHGF
jgi:hypothetical protein